MADAAADRCHQVHRPAALLIKTVSYATRLLSDLNEGDGFDS